MGWGGGLSWRIAGKMYLNKDGHRNGLGIFFESPTIYKQ
jgi:hypothetical protein